MIRRVACTGIVVLIAFSCSKDAEISKLQESFHLKVFGGSATDSGNAILSDGENLYVTGSIDYLNGPDMFLIKTDKYGNEVEWSPKLFGSAGMETGNDISLDKDNNVIVAGYSKALASGYTDVFVVKTNSRGEELWSRHFGGSRDERANALHTSVPGIIFVAGYTESVEFSYRNRQGWLLALSENGDSLWSHDYGTILVPDEISGITSMNDSLLLIGSSQSFYDKFDQNVFLFILKSTTKGIENSVTLFRTGNETGVSVIYTAAGEIIALGYSRQNSVDNILLWKLDKDLQVIRERQITSTLSETPSAVLYENGTVVVVGTTMNEAGDDDYLVYVMDNDLNTISRNTYGSKGDQKGLSGIIAGRRVIISGSTVSGNLSRASIFKTPEILP